MSASAEDAVFEEQVYGRPATEARLFVSSHMGRRGILRVERETAAKAIESIGFGRAWYWERDAHAGPYCAEEVCVRTAATSDGLVLILARKLTEMTVKEYTAARHNGVPCFIFVKQGRHDADVNAFIRNERLRAVVTESFGELKDLRRRVVDALYAYFVRAARRDVVHARLYRVTERPSVRPSTEGESGRPRYELIQLEVETEEGFKSAASLIDEARDAVAKGRPDQAFAEIYDLAIQAQGTGLPDVALELLTKLGEIVPDSSLDDTQRAWLLNTEGLARSGLGEYGRAESLFQRMLAAGERLGDDDLASTALQNLGIVAAQAGDPDAAIDYYNQSLERMQKISNYYGIAQVFLNLASALLQTGKGELAESMLLDLENLIRLFGESGLLASLHGNVGQVAASNGQFEIAERRFRRALSLARGSAKNPERELVTLQNLGSLQMSQGRPSRALRWYRNALRLAEGLGSPRGLEMTHRSLALALHALKRDQEAEAEFARAAEAAARAGNQYLWAENTANIGAVRIDLGAFGAAKAALNEALDVFGLINDVEWQVRTLANLAEVEHLEGKGAASLETLDRALALLDEPLERRALLRRAAELALDAREVARAVNYLNRELEDGRGEQLPQRGWRAATVGATLLAAGKPAEAVAFFDRAVRLYGRAHDDELLCQVLNDRAIAYGQQQLYRKARKDLTRCLQIARNVDDRSAEHQALTNLGELERRAGRIKFSLDRLGQALDLAKTLDDCDAEALTLGNLGLALAQATRLEEAREAFERTLEIARHLGDQGHEAAAVAGLAGIALDEGRMPIAARLYKRAAGLRSDEFPRHQAEALAGLVDALAGLGREEQLQDALQRLVDLAQAKGLEEVAVSGIARAAGRLVPERDFLAAASLYSLAISIAVLSVPLQEGTIKQEEANAIARALVGPVAHLIRVAESLPAVESKELYEEVIKKTEERITGFGEMIRPLIEGAASAFRKGTG